MKLAVACVDDVERYCTIVKGSLTWESSVLQRFQMQCIRLDKKSSSEDEMRRTRWGWGEMKRIGWGSDEDEKDRMRIGWGWEGSDEDEKRLRRTGWGSNEDDKGQMRKRRSDEDEKDRGWEESDEDEKDQIRMSKTKWRCEGGWDEKDQMRLRCGELRWGWDEMRWDEKGEIRRGEMPWDVSMPCSRPTTVSYRHLSFEHLQPYRFLILETYARRLLGLLFVNDGWCR